MKALIGILLVAIAAVVWLNIATPDVQQEFQYTFPLDKIALKPRAEVEKILGKPTKCKTVKPSKTPCPCDKCEYVTATDTVEIVYMNGLADWITVFPKNELIYGDKAILYLLPKYYEPKEHSFGARYFPDSLLDVTFSYGDGKKVYMIYIKSKTQ